MDMQDLRRDFAILRSGPDGRPIRYFDNACMSLRPDQVVDAVTAYYREFPACGGAGRSTHLLGRRVDRAVFETREKIRAFINARVCHDPGYERLTPTKEIVFTRNTTEAINLVANSFAFSPGAVVLTTDREHNSNLCPWKRLEQQGKITHQYVPAGSDGTFSLQKMEQIMQQEKVELVSMVHMSNLDGYKIPAAEIVRLAHAHGAKVLLDGAQSVPHTPVDVQALDVDFLAFSLHKMCGPSGVGVLYGKEELLADESFGPFMVGGDTVEDTCFARQPQYLDPPFKFEAGLQDYAGLAGAGTAIDYISGISMQAIEQRVRELGAYLMRKLEPCAHEFDLLGVPDPGLHNGVFTLCFRRRGVVSLFDEDLRGADVILDAWAGIMVRSGEFCAHSWFHEHGISREREKVRVSLYFYNTEEECDLFAHTLARLIRTDEYRMLPAIGE